MIQACAGVEVIPQGPREGDHMANGRVEMAVREVKRQCRTLWISAEQASATQLPSPLLQHENMDNMRIGRDGKTSELRRTGRRWRERSSGTTWREFLVP